MASRAEAPGRTLTGREAELAAVREVLDRAADGQSETLLVFGEAGVGKTALVQHAAAGARPPTLLLRGVCLPLLSISVPLLPLRSASRGSTGLQWPHPWPLDGLDAIEKAPALLDAWLQEVTSAAPVVLLVDDLQWADESTLDVLMYLVAGPADRRFALLATVRSQSVPDGHPFHRWLADALRLPRVTHLDLQPLDRAGTEAQVASLLGAVPHQTLVDDVFAHTLGNPYLNILVTADLEPTARRLPDDLPADLRIAVRRTWHGCHRSPGTSPAWLRSAGDRYDLSCCGTSPPTSASLTWDLHCRKPKNHESCRSWTRSATGFSILCKPRSSSSR
jgi:predicted ATPase